VRWAREAQRAEATTAPGVKAQMLYDIGEAVAREAEALAQPQSRNVGMPVGDARGAMAGVAAVFRYRAAAPERLVGETIPVRLGVDMTVREPAGVVGLITPWLPAQHRVVEDRARSSCRERRGAQTLRAEAADRAATRG